MRPALVARDAADKPTSADVILIPKQLRMEWTDVLALDSELSHVAFRVACVIGSHFNKHKGETYVSQETIARIMDVSERTVWTAIIELERRGYLLIQRREFGVRPSDGRRVCGGRGVANTYLPAFERSQVAATNTGRKLAIHCDLIWKERSQKTVRKVAADCDPTLKLPTEANPTSAPKDHTLGPAGDRLRARLGKDAFASWFGRVIVDQVGNSAVTLIAPSKFIRDWITTHYIEAVLACWRLEHPMIKSVEVTVHNTANASSRPKDATSE
jgi:hypothetical protein